MIKQYAAYSLAYAILGFWLALSLNWSDPVTIVSTLMGCGIGSSIIVGYDTIFEELIAPILGWLLAWTLIALTIGDRVFGWSAWWIALLAVGTFIAGIVTGIVLIAFWIDETAMGYEDDMSYMVPASLTR